MKIIACKSTLGGNGVFAEQEIKKDEIIEACPIVPINMKDWNHVKHTKLVDYVFAWASDPEKRVAFVLGYGMVYNHSFEPNSATRIEFDEDLLVFYALRDIQVGEEILHNYHGNSKCKEPVWFEVKS